MIPPRKHFAFYKFDKNDFYVGIMFIHQVVWGEKENFIIVNIGKWQIKIGSFIR